MQFLKINKKIVLSKSNAAILLATIAILLVGIANAEVMQSSHFKLQSDSLNFGGNNSSSTSYSMEDTLGEIATGESSSLSFGMKAGYQQMQEVYISVTPASDVTMSPDIGGLVGGVSNGSTYFAVSTDNSAGYTATIVASSSPALVSDLDSFSDYAPAGSVPDFDFTNASNNSSFGFTVEGDDIAQNFKDSSGVCGTGYDDTADACWDGLSTTAKTIVTRTSSNHPIGTLSTIKFRAASGSSHNQLDGVYVATTTVTVIAL